MSERGDAMPDYNFDELSDDALLSTVPDVCRNCPVMHDLVLDYVVAGIERVHMLNRGQALLDSNLDKIRQEVIAEQRILMEAKGVHISDQDFERMIREFDRETRQNTAGLIDDNDQLIDMIGNKIVEVYMSCHGPLNLRASRDGITHMVRICTSPVENAHSNSVRVSHKPAEE